MNKFTPADFSIKQETEEGAEARVVKLETQEKSSGVRTFELPRIHKPGDGDYAVTRAKYGPLAATDSGREGRSQKDSRFSLNSLVRAPLSITQEEMRVVDARVKERVDALEEQVKAQALELGFEEGKKKGYQDAFEKFERECAEKMTSFSHLLGELDNAKNEIFRANEDFLVSLVFRISRMVMLKELATDREYVTRLAHDILERVGLRENIRIGIHSADLLTIENMKEKLEKQLGEMKNLTIEVSSKVQMGGCFIETEFNAIDATIETQLQGLQESLTGAPQT